MKKTQFNLILLNGIFMTGLITSNLFGGKLINVCGLTVAGAIVTYPLTFLTTDIIGEIWGKDEANQCVKAGVIMQMTFLLISSLSLLIQPLAASMELQNALHMVINQGARMTIASLAAFLCSQFLDVHLFHRLKELNQGRHKWIRNNVSTMTSQLVDTAIFVTVAFAGVVPDLYAMVIGQYIIKLGLALLDTPFFYFFTRNKEKTPKTER